MTARAPRRCAAQAHPLGVIARGGAHDTPVQFLLSQRQGLVHGAPELKGTHHLEAFKFQIHLAAQRLVQGGHSEQWCAGNIRSDAALGRLDILK